jgi:hypothetical protein
MGTRGETLAKQFEAKVQEALAVVEPPSDEDWKKVTAAEHWPVGVTAHHLATAFETVPGVITAIVSGHPQGGFTRAMLDQGNAQHAQEHAHCTKAETVALLKKAGWRPPQPSTLSPTISCRRARPFSRTHRR